MAWHELLLHGYLPEQIIITTHETYESDLPILSILLIFLELRDLVALLRTHLLKQMEHLSSMAMQQYGMILIYE